MSLTCVKLKSAERYLQSGAVLQRAYQKLAIHDRKDELALLSFFSDLFRIGYLSCGADIANQSPPFFHVTTLGRTALAHWSRDPANPDGYLSHLRTAAAIGAITESYIVEGLRTFNSGCFKATAVLVGAATESIVLDVRETLLAKMQKANVSIPKDLTDWRVKRILDAIEGAVERQSDKMPKPFMERFKANWPAFAYQIRTARNEAGHPINVDPVAEDVVHGSLLIFPQLATLASELKIWINETF